MRAYHNEGKALTESFCQRCTGKFDFSHMTSSFCMLHSYIWRKLSVTVYSVKPGVYIHFKFGPILINTDRVLSSYADNELKRSLLYHCSVQTYGTNDREYH